MKDPTKVAQALLDNHAREFKGWRNCAETRSLKKRIADAIRADRLEAVKLMGVQ